jgi:hypothetical protein
MGLSRCRGKGLGSTLGEVFDACVPLSGDVDPVVTLPPHTPLQPLNRPFSEYGTRLATPGDRQLCVSYRPPFRLPSRCE